VRGFEQKRKFGFSTGPDQTRESGASRRSRVYYKRGEGKIRDLPSFPWGRGILEKPGRPPIGLAETERITQGNDVQRERFGKDVRAEVPVLRRGIWNLALWGSGGSDRL